MRWQAWTTRYGTSFSFVGLASAATHPAITTENNINTYRRQLRRLGLSHDQRRAVSTTDPSYYRWNQWFFLRMLERKQAYRARRRLNWCDRCATVLANACGPCIGQWRRDEAISSKPNTIVTSYNRNFPRRNDGQPTTMNFITSPEVTVALALSGSLSFNPLTDPLTDSNGQSVYLKDIWPSAEEVSAVAADRNGDILIPTNGSA